MERLRRYVAMREAKPLSSLADPIHAIHTGTEWAAELNLADLKAILSESAPIEYTRGRLDGYVAGRIFEAKRCADLCKDNDGSIPDNTAQVIHDAIQKRLKEIS